MRISNTFNDRVIEIGSHFNVYMELNSSNVLSVKENIDINLLKCALKPLNQTRKIGKIQISQPLNSK